MQAHIISLHTHSTPVVGSKRQTFFFLKVVMLHIKLKRMKRRVPCNASTHSVITPISTPSQGQIARNKKVQNKRQKTSTKQNKNNTHNITTNIPYKL